MQITLSGLHYSGLDYAATAAARLPGTEAKVSQRLLSSWDGVPEPRLLLLRHPLDIAASHGRYATLHLVNQYPWEERCEQLALALQNSGWATLSDIRAPEDCGRMLCGLAGCRFRKADWLDLPPPARVLKRSLDQFPDWLSERIARAATPLEEITGLQPEQQDAS